MQADIALRMEDEGRPSLAQLVRFHAIDEGVVFDEGGLTVSAIRTEHPPLIDCFALSFKTVDAHVVFSDDTAPIQALEDFARGADLLIHEAMLKSALPALMARIGNATDKLIEHWLRSHTYAHDAARTAANAEVKALALSHLIPSDDPDYSEEHWQDAVAPEWPGPLHIGRDSMRIDLPSSTDRRAK